MGELAARLEPAQSVLGGGELAPSPALSSIPLLHELPCSGHTLPHPHTLSTTLITSLLDLDLRVPPSLDGHGGLTTSIPSVI